MKNRLITLIDFSLYSHTLAELAARWCKVSHAQLLFVHQVIAILPGLAEDITKDEITKIEEDAALQKLKIFSEAKELDDLEVRYVVRDSHLLNTIDELLREGYNDIILVGIRGKGMLRKLLIGNTATMIIDEIDRTVVAVPDKLCTVPNAFCNLVPKRLVISLSYRFPLNNHALDRFLKQFDKLIARLEFISSIDDDQETNAIQYLSSLATHYSMTHETSYRIFKGRKHFEQIKSYVQSEQDTILMVQKGSRNLTDHLFRRFLINEVIHDGSLPLVVLPANGRSLVPGTSGKISGPQN